jgi:hypothetical protein
MPPAYWGNCGSNVFILVTKSLGLDFPGRIHGQHSFFGKPGKQHSDGGHVLFDRGRRGSALQRFDVSRDRDGLNVFKILIPGALGPG